jgi:hypothetical protein
MREFLNSFPKGEMKRMMEISEGMFDFFLAKLSVYSQNHPLPLEFLWLLLDDLHFHSVPKECG